MKSTRLRWPIGPSLLLAAAMPSGELRAQEAPASSLRLTERVAYDVPLGFSPSGATSSCGGFYVWSAAGSGADLRFMDDTGLRLVYADRRSGPIQGVIAQGGCDEGAAIDVYLHDRLLRIRPGQSPSQIPIRDSVFAVTSNATGTSLLTKRDGALAIRSGAHSPYLETDFQRDPSELLVLRIGTRTLVHTRLPPFIATTVEDGVAQRSGVIQSELYPPDIQNELRTGNWEARGLIEIPGGHVVVLVDLLTDRRVLVFYDRLGAIRRARTIDIPLGFFSVTSTEIGRWLASRWLNRRELVIYDVVFSGR